MRPELKPLLDYLARLVLEDLQRSATLQTSAKDQTAEPERTQAPDLPTHRSAA